ncbi:LysR family transcriptional regulator [Streptomyces sp. S1D4-11]
MDLDLRKLRYFTAVAQHEHFGRAAAQLHIAQPVLSRQIRALEQELGCTLLVRTTRSVRLTPMVSNSTKTHRAYSPPRRPPPAGCTAPPAPTVWSSGSPPV